MIYLKTEKEIEIMREGGKRLGEILNLLINMTSAGTTTVELDKEAEIRIRKAGGEAAFKGYRAFGLPTAFPGSICVSINDEIVHGLPYPERVIQEGDIVSIDIGMKYKNLYIDTAKTVGVGKLSENENYLIDITRKSLETAIKMLKEKLGRGTTADVGASIDDSISGSGFNIVRELVGHGVGRLLHEEPSVPNFRIKGPGDPLRPGTTIAIEPMIYEGKPGVSFEEMGWSVFTTNGGRAAHFEHSVAILDDDVLVLTNAD